MLDISVVMCLFFTLLVVLSLVGVVFGPKFPSGGDVVRRTSIVVLIFGTAFALMCFFSDRVAASPAGTFMSNLHGEIQGVEADVAPLRQDVQQNRSNIRKLIRVTKDLIAVTDQQVHARRAAAQRASRYLVIPKVRNTKQVLGEGYQLLLGMESAGR